MKEKYYGKYPTTAEEKALAQQIESLHEEANRLQEVEDNLFKEYFSLEGKYAIGTVPDPFAGQGCRGYDYRYASQEDKVQELREREVVRVKAWEVRTQTNEIRQQAWDLEKEMCVLMHGYTEEEYRAREWVKKAEKDVAEALERLEECKKELEEIQKRA
jgi:hypothetical protein